jgi:hypothetical protein
MNRAKQMMKSFRIGQRGLCAQVHHVCARASCVRVNVCVRVAQVRAYVYTHVYACACVRDVCVCAGSAWVVSMISIPSSFFL